MLVVDEATAGILLALADQPTVESVVVHWPRHGDTRFGVRQECGRWRR